ncbi:DEAD/DEAH box helicase [Chitinilyticum aquatile]|uniref:DEAD/DEAH box helicase n=1 Tax=Chitinilyticum aquatile TaxID=362520 RepID=UPI0004180C36|nr:DEAD/DEAH box helicase [Chitinilyticum aquatile]
MPLPERPELLKALALLPAVMVTRGRDYLRQGRVQIDAVSARGADALVHGTHTYPVHVAFRQGRVISAVCACPVAHDCKHIAATLLQLLESQPEGVADESAAAEAAQARQLRAARHWLDNLLQSLPQAHRNEEHIRYVLTPGSERGLPVLRLEAQVQYRLKNGKWSTPKRPNLDKVLSNYQVPAYVQPDDISLFRLLSSGSFYRADPLKQPLPLHVGAMVLQLLAQSGRCQLQQQDGPLLHWAGPRDVRIDWQGDDAGMQPKPFIAEGCELIPFDRPCWINAETGECGEAVSPLDAVQLRAVLAAPPLPEAVWVELASCKTAEWGKTGLRLPASARERIISGVAPQPQLAVSRPPGLAADVLLLQPGFAYADAVIKPVPKQPLNHLPDGRLLERELAAEDAWLAALPDSYVWECPALAPLLHQLGPEDRALSAPADVLAFLQHGVAALEAAGWQVTLAGDAALRVLSPESWWAELDEDGEQEDWFGLDMGIVVEGEKISLLPLLVDAIRKAPADYQLAALGEADSLLLPAGGGRFLKLPGERLKPILATLTELFDAEVRTDAPLRLPFSHAGRLADLGDFAWSGGTRLRELGDRLRSFQGITPLAAPAGFQATLRPYQQQGLSWLQFLREYGLNGILADDMGLGKTVQALAHIAHEKAAGRLDRPCLVVAPTSLMFNWQREAAQFAPDLRVLLLHGNDRKTLFGDIAAHDLVLTTYPLLCRDAGILQEQAWHLLVLDEAQAIKNPKSQSAVVVRELSARHRLCLTGTPMENHLGELWALFDFLMPGFLGAEKTFNALFRVPIERQADGERRQQLSRRVAPFLLRRTKEQVATELPPKTEIIRMTELQGAQRDLYETVRLALSEKVRQEVAARGFKRSQIVILDALLKLREVCCDPRLVNLAQARTVQQSAKLEMLLELLPELLEEGRRILVFSQFTRMLALIEDELKQRQISYVKLTGQTKDRATPVERFQNGEVPVFLISLKAGGVGLNLTAADTVIHYDPWWNPAVEDQATDRAYRIGQDKPVFVYKLVCAGSVEEKMQAMKDRKKALADGVYGEAGERAAQLEAGDLSALFSPLE